MVDEMCKCACERLCKCARVCKCVCVRVLRVVNLPLHHCCRLFPFSLKHQRHSSLVQSYAYYHCKLYKHTRDSVQVLTAVPLISCVYFKAREMQPQLMRKQVNSNPLQSRSRQALYQLSYWQPWIVKQWERKGSIKQEKPSVMVAN